MIDVFTKVVLAGACLFTFAWVILVQRRTIRRLSDAYLRLTHFQRVLVALAVVICTVYAQKPSTNNVEGATGTNEVETVGGGGETNEVEIVGGGGEGATNAPPLMMAGRAFTNESLDYVMLPDLAKWVLMFLMLAGRVEIFALMALFQRLAR